MKFRKIIEIECEKTTCAWRICKLWRRFMTRSTWEDTLETRP